MNASLAGAGAGAAPSLPYAPPAYRGAEGQYSGAYVVNTYANTGTTNEARRPNSVHDAFTHPVAQDTATAVLVPDADHSLLETEVSPGTHLLHVLHGAEGQGTYPHSHVSRNATPLSGGELHTSPQVQGRTAAPERFSQTPGEGPLPTEPNVLVETSYPLRYRDPMDAFVSAMQENSRRLDDLERGLTGSQDEASGTEARSSRLNLIVTLVGLMVMLTAGGTKLYDTIHPPSAH